MRRVKYLKKHNSRRKDIANISGKNHMRIEEKKNEIIF